MSFIDRLKAGAVRGKRAQTTPLSHSHLQITIEDLLAEYELRHVFRNEGDKAMEAVYSFPIPLDAAFLGMEAVLAGERRVAEVLPARQASRRYDDALADGDSAVLLERLEQGLLCVNLGNLKPGEEGVITLRFTAALNVSDGQARFSLPLVHRPRYGRSTLDELVEPQHNFAIEHPLQAQIRIRGLLADCPVQCATQGARFQSKPDQMLLDLGHAMLDRDLVLTFDLVETNLSRSRWVADGDQSIGVLTFVPQALPAEQPNQPLDLCLVLDSSGSMEGDAIGQSRHALLSVANALDDDDRIQVLRFGSTVVPLFRRPLKASTRVKESLAILVSTVQSDLGGTDVEVALDHAIESLAGTKQAGRLSVIILVTDGAVQPSEVHAAQQRAGEAGVRIFVVAVGSSAGVDVLAPLASSTLATLERAVPAEPIDAAVMRQFRRARMPKPLDIQINWGSDVEGLPLGIVYPGDAVTAVARIADQSKRTIHVNVPATSSALSFDLVNLEDSPAWRAWSGQQCYLQATGTTKADLALRYGLITEETSAVLVKIRAEDEKVDGLPVVVPVRHMTPDGMTHAMSAHSVIMSKALSMANRPIRNAPPEFNVADSSVDYLDMPAFCRRSTESEEELSGTEPESIIDTVRLDHEQSQRAAALLIHALLDVLVRAVADDDLMIEVLLQLDGAERELVEQYLLESYLSFESRHVALSLLVVFREINEEEALTDDQEALYSAFQLELEQI